MISSYPGIYSNDFHFRGTQGFAEVRMSSKGVRSPSTQPSLARESPMGGLPTMEDEEDFFKFSSDDCR